MTGLGPLLCVEASRVFKNQYKAVPGPVNTIVPYVPLEETVVVYERQQGTCLLANKIVIHHLQGHFFISESIKAAALHTDTLAGHTGALLGLPMDPAEEESSDGAIAISFNHDASCVSIGTRAGFYIYNLTPTLEVRIVYVSLHGECVVDSLFTSSFDSNG